MAQSPFTAQAAWPNVSNETLTAPANSDLSQLEATVNYLLTALQRCLVFMGGGDVPMTTAVPTIGTTVTMATPAQFIAINGVIGSVAAETAKAFGALGTIPAGKWGLITIERIANGTTTFVSAAANYTSGYDTEALAIAAMPAQSADKAVTGYITIQGGAGGWIAGTDALAGGTGGTPAAATNYYGTPGAADTTSWTNVKQIGNPAGTLVTG
jgi:hypothetical protein